MELNHPILESLDRAQYQRYLAMPPRDEWDAVADEDGRDADDEFVDRARVEE